MKRILFSVTGILLCVGAMASTPLWLRDAAISPDGSRVAFCYKGDIYTVPASGGAALRMTSLTSSETGPVWSPDSRSIAFSSDRYGSFDVFVMDAAGGNARRLTFNSAKETACAFSPDGSRIYFNAHIQDPAESAQFPSASLGELYCVPVSGGRSSLVLGTPAENICFSPDGSFFLYQDKKGNESSFRKHHTSSITRDIWRYDVATGRHTNLTNRPGEDLNPVLGADGKTVYCLSEAAGKGNSINLWSFSLDNPGQMKAESRFTTHPLRSLSRAGDTFCYSWNGELYIQKTGGEPRKVEVVITRDEENIPVHSIASSGARDAVVSPDGKQIAFVVRGEVFVSSVEYGTTRQITHTAAAESRPTFSKDGRSLVYCSYRDGFMQLYKATVSRKDDPSFPYATIIEEKPFLHKAGTDRSDPCFSPDGKHIAFIEGRTRLMTASADGSAVREVTDGSAWFCLGTPFEYDWSPDGKWFTLTYVPSSHDPYYDIGLVSAKGGQIYNITGSGYMCGNPRFTPDGQAILFTSERYGMRNHASWGSQDDIFICFLNREAYDRYRLSKEDYEMLKETEKSSKQEKKDSTAKDEKKAPQCVKVEPDGLSDRIVRLTSYSGGIGDYIVSKDGETMYYCMNSGSSSDVWKMDLRNRSSKIFSKSSGHGHFTSDASGKTIFILGSSFRKLDGGSFQGVPFKAEYNLDRSAEREFMFDYVCREEQERFYDAGMHGVDWKGITDNYRRFLPHISDNRDFAEMLSEMLGELNVSHTGAFCYSDGPSESTASLGLLFDVSYKGEGLKVAEIIAGGPFDRDDIKLSKGDVITRIDGIKITVENDCSLLLGGKAGKKTLVSVAGRKDMTVKPITQARLSALLYDRWVRQRAADVEKWSGGRLGYVHIKSMNDLSFRTVYSDILGKYNKCEGIVIDTRFNGGGRMHEDIEILFSGEKYLTQVTRGRESCDMPSRRWNKPSIMLQAEANYSNAHGTPWVYRHRKIGRLVGAPVPGTMTSVNWVHLQDPSLVFGIPVIGYRTTEGNYLENTQLEPDVLVLNSPETLVKGEDTQLRVAVEELLKELK